MASVKPSLTRKVIHHPDGVWRIELDARQIIPEDPGAGTPAMLYGRKSGDPHYFSGTFFRALDTGEVCVNAGPRDDDETLELPDSIIRWLDGVAIEVDDFMLEHS